MHVLILRGITEAREQGTQWRIPGEQLVLCQLTNHCMGYGSPGQRRGGVTQPEHETTQDRGDARRSCITAHQQRRLARVEVGGCFKRCSDLQESRFTKRWRNHLQANGELLTCQPTGHGHGR